EGARAPRLVREEDLKLMKPGAVIIDVAIDQGGRIEASRPTTHSQPTYLVNGVVHYDVTHTPTPVGRPSTDALCNRTSPSLTQRAQRGMHGAAALDPGLANAVNMDGGKLTNKAVADTFGLPYVPYQPAKS